MCRKIRQHVSESPIQLEHAQVFSIQTSIGICINTPEKTTRLNNYSNMPMMRFIVPSGKDETKWSFRHNLLQFS